MSKAHRLIQTWRAFRPRRHVNVLPGDKRLLESPQFHPCSSFQEYIRDPDFGSCDEHRLHVGLIPIPYIGNLASARVFILMLNPGFTELDYFAEDHSSDYRKALTDSLCQRIGKNDFPMVSLNPKFSWSGGYQYWVGKLGQIIRAIQGQRRCTWTEAPRVLSGEIACIELYPYHSRSSGLSDSIQILESARLAKDYVHEILIPKARKDKALIVVTRQSRVWELPRHRNIVVYSGVESRAAHLTLKSKGGQRIAEFLDLPVA